MSTEWPTMTLRAAGVALIDCVHKTPEAALDGYPYVTIPQMVNGRIDFSTARQISSSDFEAWTKKARPKPWDVVLSRRCNPGETVVVAPGEEFALGQNLVLLRADGSHVFPQFLRWLTRSPEWWSQIQKNLNVGAIFDSLKCGDVPEFELRIPPRAEQNAIAEVLGSLDDKIEQNRRTAQALEGLARATFKAWFVDFEPVKVKAAGAASFPGMPPAAFAALPNRLIDSRVGSVPQGWKVMSLSTVAKFLNGLALQKYPPGGDDTDLPVIKIAELRKGSTEGSALAKANVPDAYVIEDGDLLFSWSGTLEAELWFGGRGALNQHLFKVTSDDYPRWLCLHWVRQHLPEFRLIASSKATTMGHIKRGHLDDAQVVVPDDATLLAANDMIGPLYDLHADLALETRKLEALRDYLLPQMQSGLVRVLPSQPEVKA